MQQRAHRVRRQSAPLALDIVADTFPDLHVSTYGYDFGGRDVRVVTLSGVRAEDAATLLERRVPCYSLAELLVAAHLASPDELDLALLRLVCAAPDEPDATIIERLQRALDQDRADQRLAALRAITVRPWPAFIPLAERIAANDPDEDTRFQAKLTLIQLRDPPPPWS